MNQSANEKGVSDVLGAIILVAVVAGAIGIASVAILSEPQPEKVPSLSSEIDIVGRTVLITHTGGDPLEKEDMSIRLGGTDMTESFSKLGGGPWSGWAVGDTLVYETPDGEEIPDSIQVLYVGQTSAKILYSWGEAPLLTPSPTITTIPTPQPVVAAFVGSPTSGEVPLGVQFTDQSTGMPATWNWSFGDGNVSMEQNPFYLYPDIGNFTVSLNVTNAFSSDSLTKVEYIEVQPLSFVNYTIEENVFVYGSQLSLSGDIVNGPYATVILTDSLVTSDLNGGAAIAVNTIYVDGDVTLDGGSASLGSPTNPGAIYVNGDLTLWSGTRDIYGDVYVAGNFALKDAHMHGNVYVDGDLTLGWTPTVDGYIYYTGTLTAPAWYPQSILDRCIHQDTVPGFTMPTQEIPSAKPAAWYAERGYVSGGPLVSGAKIYATSYSTTTPATAYNVIVVASSGDISITGGWGDVTGILFAPNGKITFYGASFQGVAIARDGFDVTSGGTEVLFKNIDEYISDPDDYPF